MDKIKKVIEIIGTAMHVTAFCGAGISVESGIPPFRGEGGLWNKYDPACLDLDLYLQIPEKNWVIIKELFYDFFGKANPNPAHYSLSNLEEMGILKTIITQNIDNLHQEAGSKNIIEFHGNSHRFICTKCQNIFSLSELQLNDDPPLCPSCRGLLKPDFIFFGEAIPERAMERSLEETELADVFLVIGTTGEIMPACIIPRLARQRGAIIIEINPGYSAYKNSITQFHLAEPAGKILPEIIKGLKGE